MLIKLIKYVQWVVSEGVGGIFKSALNIIDI